VVEHRDHNPRVDGSSPSPATSLEELLDRRRRELGFKDEPRAGEWGPTLFGILLACLFVGVGVWIGMHLRP
jgi:hypothetical protein